MTALPAPVEPCSEDELLPDRPTDPGLQFAVEWQVADGAQLCAPPALEATGLS